jgi:hypothetical protein
MAVGVVTALGVARPWYSGYASHAAAALDLLLFEHLDLIYAYVGIFYLFELLLLQIDYVLARNQGKEDKSMRLEGISSIHDTCWELMICISNW